MIQQYTIPYSGRWKACDLSWQSKYPSTLAHIQGCIPRLEQLRIVLGAGTTSMISASSDAPLFRETHRIGFRPGFCGLPWGQLTTLRLGYHALIFYIGVLSVEFHEEVAMLKAASTLHIADIGWDSDRFFADMHALTGGVSSQICGHCPLHCGGWTFRTPE
ncbi:hypothetical protein C8F04DRAFT_1136334 [Mycena alexandri]|uniref:Uncharacterized protein n=1 Tax=Mycena alexandri TaxID=1745969 RepID=A0AAD6SCF3_9AGAR|nr:hypothetical protein C8F04DRAFT_1136334 [Mycena alexandri]